MNAHENDGSPPESFANHAGALPNDSAWNREEGTGNRGGEEGREQGDRNREAADDPVEALIALTRTLVTFATSRDGDDEITPTVEELVTEHGLDAIDDWLTSRPSHTRYRYARDLAFALRRDLTTPAPTGAPPPPVWTPLPGLTGEERAEADRAFAELVATHRRTSAKESAFAAATSKKPQVEISASRKKLDVG